MKDKAHKALNGTHNNRELDGIFDPLDVIESLDPSEVILLESADVATKLGEKSLLFLDLALKIECKNSRLCFSALGGEGELLLSALREYLKASVKEEAEPSLVIDFEPLFNELDMLLKMRMKSPLDALRAIFELIGVKENHQQKLMLAGVFSYDFLDHFEKLPLLKKDVFQFPDFLFFVPLSIIEIHHRSKKCELSSWSFKGTKEASSRLVDLEQRVKKAIASFAQQKPQLKEGMSELNLNNFSVDSDDQEFGRLVEKCKSYIKSGDVYQIVPSRTFSRPVKNALQCYRSLRSLNPSPYMFFLKTSEWTLLGASPETFIKVEDKRMLIRPIAGTRRRGLDDDGRIDDELDAREQASLCLDEKELAEHMMLVDLARNDIASVAQPGSRRIKRLLGVDRYSHVMHLVSEVEGVLKDDYDALSAYQASMNMGTLMGAPKIRAAELLRELELSKRGFYGGAVGYINQAGAMDTAIIIRSALIKDGIAYVRAGCGVVYDSAIEFEVKETLNKAEAVLKALELAESL